MNFPAANRDPAAFERPDEVVLDRADNRHVAFGTGIHRCAGSNLARMELRVAVEEWFARIPTFRLADEASGHLGRRPGLGAPGRFRWCSREDLSGPGEVPGTRPLLLRWRPTSSPSTTTASRRLSATAPFLPGVKKSRGWRSPTVRSTHEISEVD